MHGRIILTVLFLALGGSFACKDKAARKGVIQQPASKEPKAVEPPRRTPKHLPPPPCKVVPPPRHKKTKAERYKEPQPGVLTKDELTHMLTTARDMWMQPDRVVKELAIPAGSQVADVGCGSGYWTFRLSKVVGAKGLVYGVDFDRNAIEYMKERLAKKGTKNIKLILSKSFDTRLKPKSIDLALLVNVHFLKQPNEPEDSQVSEDFPGFYKSVHRALRPKGRMAMVEPDKDTKSSRHVSTTQIAKQMEEVGFKLKKKYDILKGNYFMVFVKK